MGKGRLEAFSDGVLAIIITIMVLEMKVPHGTGFASLMPVLPVFLSYLLSFVYVGIYWNNHHHFMHAAQKVDGRVLWGNLHLLFWISLFPFVTAWMGENHFASAPVALYGVALLLAALAWQPFQRALIAANGGKDAALARAIGRRDWKGWSSVALYATAIPLAFVDVRLSGALYVVVALMWLIPDRRVESRVKSAT